MDKECLKCNSIFTINEKWKQERKRKFCSKSCSNSYNNNIRYNKIKVDSKICRICNEEKDVTMFYKRKKSVDGYRNDCKICLNDYTKNNPNRKKNKKKYYENNKEYIIDKSR